MEAIITFFDSTMTKPALYGWFHLIWLGITAVAVFLAAYFGPKATKKQVDNLLYRGKALLRTILGKEENIFEKNE